MHSWDWDDLKYVVAVADHRSLAAAARALGVNHSTVLRRIGSFETANGFRLFDRMASGYTLTETGEDLLDSARQMQEIVRQLEGKLRGKDERLEGTLRVTTCDTLMASVLPHVLAGFSELNPGITVALTTGSFVTDLAQRDADVALRTGDSPPDALVGRRAVDVSFAIYGTVDLVERNAGKSPTEFDRWVAPDMTLGGMKISRWLGKAIPESSIAMRGDSLVSLLRAAECGQGFAVLPCYLGSSGRNLVKVDHPDFDEMTTGLWVLTHQDLRRTARVRAFTSYVSHEFRRSQVLFRGNR
ncbi:LysR family transcriptional regulator [Pararhizobium sp. YC-54]|uniref:LysR family transcriptional regulator n=1 Tax=Pararhizobium sp. YC-54 TaxID=2986920 RepID=UPI0021F7C8AD|nr:LysR family transcriptional regulator [Pararhizobium sp. YC-54]MCV9999352.1 LysR family transcriptional regulator [Pararhizobium sp. YC-54]